MFGLVLDVTSGEWIRKGTDIPASASFDDAQFAGEADLQSQIDECERCLQELRGPRVPAFSHEAMTRLAGGQLPWVWQQDAVMLSGVVSKRIPARLCGLHGLWLKMSGSCCIDLPTVRLKRCPAGTKCQRRPIRRSDLVVARLEHVFGVGFMVIGCVIATAVHRRSGRNRPQCRCSSRLCPLSRHRGPHSFRNKCLCTCRRPIGKADSHRLVHRPCIVHSRWGGPMTLLKPPTLIGAVNVA